MDSKCKHTASTFCKSPEGRVYITCNNIDCKAWWFPGQVLPTNSVTITGKQLIPGEIIPVDGDPKETLTYADYTTFKDLYYSGDLLNDNTPNVPESPKTAGEQLQFIKSNEQNILKQQADKTKLKEQIEAQKASIMGAKKKQSFFNGSKIKKNIEEKEQALAELEKVYAKSGQAVLKAIMEPQTKVVPINQSAASWPQPAPVIQVQPDNKERRFRLDE